jgi:hypothetical protein
MNTTNANTTNANTTNTTNTINIQVGAIRHPEFGELFEGAEICLCLSDKAMSDCNQKDLQSLKFALPILVEGVETFVEKMLAREDAQRAERKAAVEKENAALMKEWEAQLAEYEEAKAAFEKRHAAWEQKRSQTPEEEIFTESEPVFYRERPHRPHLSIY